ncbi:MAG: PQQ-binding-like beta-propeller repeat protein [Acidobacteriota bacterium]
MLRSVVPVLMRVFLFTTLFSSAPAADWPMWRYDAGRTASSPEELPSQLYPQWTRQYPPREPVWDDPLNWDLMSYDTVFEPIVLGNMLYLGFNDRDKVVALDIRTGEEKWTFYADGPVRLPLAASRNRLFFTSDDGYLYCLSADTGALRWKFRGGPRDRKILGNKRLISTWPARGGVVVYQDTVYFAASIWPFMGTFIYALDAETGRVIWRNEGTGADYQKQPHNSPAFAGVAPQGALVALADRLLIPGGRSVPACFDRRTGRLLYYRLSEYNKTGGAFVCANERHFFNHYRDRDTDLYDLKSGKPLGRRLGKYPVLAGRTYYMSGESVVVRNAGQPEAKQFTLKVDATGDLIKAGSRLYAGGDGQIVALRTVRNDRLDPDWVQKVDGQVRRLVAANGMLFAVTLEGKLIAFGKDPVTVVDHARQPEAPRPRPEISEAAQVILRQTGTRDGYALFYGTGEGDGDLLASLALSSALDIVAVVPGTEAVASLRQRFDLCGLLGKRVHVLEGTPESFEPPPYMNSLVILGNRDDEWRNDRALQRMVASIRPYGGKIWIPSAWPDSRSTETGRRTQESSATIRELLNLEPPLSVKHVESATVFSKDGPLPGGAANWTHQYGNIANTVKSGDQLVRLPLGILWFGGSSNLDVLPRHGHGPPEQIVDGRLIIEGIDCISARDIYTGRVLWKAALEKSATLGQYYDETYDGNAPLTVKTNQRHIPGANARGTNFIATSDWVYVLQGNQCHVLDIRTGERVNIFSLPARGGVKPSRWGYIGVSADKLIAGSDFVTFPSAPPAAEADPKGKAGATDRQRAKLEVFGKFDAVASKSLVVMDRQNGSVKWSVDARYGFIHNAIAASNDVLYCLDKLPPGIEKRLQRRGRQPPADYRLLALDLATGRVLWERNTGIFGSWLSYSQEHDRLLQATRPSRDMLTDETGERMAVYVASTGHLVWDRKIKYNNPPILHGDQIITDNAAYSLATGERKLRVDPVTGEDILWSYSRTYGCNYNIASQHLLSFRSAAAGFYDLLADSGTGNLGGFKSGCTSNLIAAGGLLNAPDYTRTCQCSYQNQTSLALIHMPELEYWTTNDFVWNGKPVERIGLNLNAPGDRVAQDGTLWLDFPSVGGKSPDLPVRLQPSNPQAIRRHSLTLKPNGQEWVAASGLAGPLKLEVTLSSPAEKATYTVKLHFAELENRKPGERVFHVRLQAREVLRQFDIAQEAGGADTPVVKTFTKVPVEGLLTVECVPSSGGAQPPPLLCGIEIVREDPSSAPAVD